MFCHCCVSNDNIGKPNEDDWNGCYFVKIDEEECKGDDSEADGMKEEWKMTSNKINVSFTRFEVSKLSKVDIENVDLNCASQKFYK